MKSLTTTSEATVTYQWMRCTNAVTVTPSTAPSGCAIITGATASTYIPVLADRTKYLVVQVKATNTSESVKTRWSLSTSVVANS